MKFSFPEVAPYLNKSIIRPCIEYCYHAWTGGPSCYLYMLDIGLVCKTDGQKQSPKVFYKKGVLKKFTKFTGKHLYQSLFFNKVAGLRDSGTSFFLVNFVKFLRTPFLQNISGRLLLDAPSLADSFESLVQTLVDAEAVVRKCSVKKVLLEISPDSQENTCVKVFFNKVADLRPATLSKKRLWHRCFPVNFAKFLRIPFLIEHLWWLLL